MSDQKHFTLDGREVPFTEGQTIMQAASAAGIYIPHLCYLPEFAPHGSCKLCSVKVGKGFTSACFEPARAGLVVESDTEEVRALRRDVVQMLFSEGNHYCPFCEKSGNCQLQAVAYYLDMEDTHYPHQYPRRGLDASHHEALIDYDRCILCELCVRASRDVDHKNVFSIAGRGHGAHLAVNSESGHLCDTDFSIEDRAAHVCPVGAILIKRKGFVIPIGERLYDHRDIAAVGHHQPDEVDREK